MSQENVDKARAFIEAYNRRDFDAAVESFDPEIDWVLPGAPGLRLRAAGPDEVIRFWEGIDETFDELKLRAAGVRRRRRPGGDPASPLRARQAQRHWRSTKSSTTRSRPSATDGSCGWSTSPTGTRRWQPQSWAEGRLFTPHRLPFPAPPNREVGNVDSRDSPDRARWCCSCSTRSSPSTGSCACATSAEEAFSDIDVQLKRRHDLIPNLVETVKGYAAHERQTFENVTAARANAVAATGPQQQAQAENALSGALRQLFAVAENYPDLKASQNFLELQNELTDTEDKIQASRRFYNMTVRDLNVKIEQFPSSVVARFANL